MSRKRNPKSRVPFLGLGLEKDEEIILQRKLAEEDISGAKLLRKLIRAWIKVNT